MHVFVIHSRPLRMTFQSSIFTLQSASFRILSLFAEIDHVTAEHQPVKLAMLSRLVEN